MIQASWVELIELHIRHTAAGAVRDAGGAGPVRLPAHGCAPRKTSYNYGVLRPRRVRPVRGSGRGVPIPMRWATVEGDGARRGASAPKHAINLFATGMPS